MSAARRGRARRPRSGECSPTCRIEIGATGTLGRGARIRHRRDFLRVQKTGTRVHGQAFTVVAAPGATGRARVGCAVSKRVGNAVVRARVRRMIKETFRRVATRLPPADVVVIAKPFAAELVRRKLADVAAVLTPAMDRASRRATDRGRPA